MGAASSIASSEHAFKQDGVKNTYILTNAINDEKSICFNKPELLCNSRNEKVQASNTELMKMVDTSSILIEYQKHGYGVEKLCMV